MPRTPTLARRLALAFLGLVAAVLAVNGSISMWFAYQEATAAAIRIEQEKADAAGTGASVAFSGARCGRDGLGQAQGKPTFGALCYSACVALCHTGGQKCETGHQKNRGRAMKTINFIHVSEVSWLGR